MRYETSTVSLGMYTTSLRTYDTYISRFKYNLSSDDPSIQRLESIISPYVNDFSPDDEIGWEEYTLKSLAFSLNKKSDIFCTDLGKNAWNF